MLNEDFCIDIEYYLCNVFENRENEATRGFWCDGVLLSESENHYSPKYVNEHRQVTLKAFIGKDGQSEYVLILHFGDKSLSRLARNLSLKEYLPSINQLDRFQIDTQQKRIDIMLG